MRLQVALAGALAGEANCLAFDGDARLQHVVEDVGLRCEAERQRLAQHRGVGAAHERAAAVLDVEQAEHGQRPQCLAQHRPADIESGRQLALGQQPVAGLELSGEQAVAEEGEHARRAALCFLRVRLLDVDFGHAVVRPLYRRPKRRASA